MNLEKEYDLKYHDLINLTNDERLDYITKDKRMSIHESKINDLIDINNKITWKSIDFTIHLVPKGTPRPKLGNRGVFYVKGAKEHRKVFKKIWEEISKNHNMIQTATKFYCKAYLPTPSSMSVSEKVCAEKGIIRPISKPDWDNLAKTYCDMIQQTLLYDDSLIIEGSLSKYYSILPRIEIHIEYASGFDCLFNQNKILSKGVN